MLIHFSCPYEKVSKQSTKNIRTQILKSDKNAIMWEMALKPCRSVLTSLFLIILNCSDVMKQTEFFHCGFCFIQRTKSIEFVDR